MPSQNNHLSQFVKSDLSNSHFLLRTLNNNTFQFLIRWSSSSKPANFSHVKCVWFPSLNFLGFLKKNLTFQMVLKKSQWLPNITKDSQRFPKNAKCGCTKRQILAPPYQDYAYPYLGKITEARYQEILLRSHKKTWHSKWCVRSPNDFQTSPKIPKDFQRMPNMAEQSAKSWHHLTKITHIHPWRDYRGKVSGDLAEIPHVLAR